MRVGTFASAKSAFMATVTILSALTCVPDLGRAADAAGARRRPGPAEMMRALRELPRDKIRVMTYGDQSTNETREIVPISLDTSPFRIYRPIYGGVANAPGAEGGGADISDFQVSQLHYETFDCDDAQSTIVDAICQGEDCNLLSLVWTETTPHTEVEVFIDDEIDPVEVIIVDEGGPAVVSAVPGLSAAQLEAGPAANGCFLRLPAGEHTIRVEELDSGTLGETTFDVLAEPPEFSEIQNLECDQGGPGAGEGSCVLLISMSSNATFDFYNYIIEIGGVRLAQPFDVAHGIPTIPLGGAPSTTYRMGVIPGIFARDEDGEINPSARYTGCETLAESECELDCDNPPCRSLTNFEASQWDFELPNQTIGSFLLWSNGQQPRDADGDGVADTPPYPGGVQIYQDGVAEGDPQVSGNPEGFPTFAFLGPHEADSEVVFGAEGLCTPDIVGLLKEDSLVPVRGGTPHGRPVVEQPLYQNDENGNAIIRWENDEASAWWIPFAFLLDANGAISAAVIFNGFNPAGSIEFRNGGNVTGVGLPPAFGVPYNDNQHILAIVYERYIDGSLYASGFVPAASRVDSDGDGLFDDEDNCPDISNREQDDFDTDGVGDDCDNCPETANPDQSDENEDGIGDACSEGGVLFIRGVCSNNGLSPQLTDAIFLLNFLFTGGAAPTCRAACDTDAGGTLELTDAVAVLGFLFLGNPPPRTWIDGVPTCEVFDDRGTLTCEEENSDCNAAGPVR